MWWLIYVKRERVYRNGNFFVINRWKLKRVYNILVMVIEEYNVLG